MNLVAKEFVAARDDERGVLILSRFAGAARELPEALLVNPLDVDQSAGALADALGMNDEQQADRMRVLRAVVAEFNSYRWAAEMLADGAPCAGASMRLAPLEAAFPFPSSSSAALKPVASLSAGPVPQ